MKKISILILLIIMIFIATRLYYIYDSKTTNLDIISNGQTDEKRRILNTKYDDATINGIGHWLTYAIEGELDWNNLPLTESFKEKYKNGKEIMKEYDNYYMISSGSSFDDNFKQLISIFAYHKPAFFDFNNDNPIMTIYYYRYKLSDDNKIDDIELLRKETVSATTGEPIK